MSGAEHTIVGDPDVTSACICSLHGRSLTIHTASSKDLLVEEGIPLEAMSRAEYMFVGDHGAPAVHTVVLKNGHGPRVGVRRRAPSTHNSHRYHCL